MGRYRVGHIRQTLKRAKSHLARESTATEQKLYTNGHLEVLQWARARGCSSDKWTCAMARKGRAKVMPRAMRASAGAAAAAAEAAAAAGRLPTRGLELQKSRKSPRKVS